MAVHPRQRIWMSIGLENEHVYLLKGYDLDRNVVIVNDSLNGEMEYDMNRFKECYEQCYKQAVIIY